ncbi:adenosylcobinamide amidohydrolase [Methanohalophilus mahii]|uniref:Adenosylcobinamide hydrolase n=1 Tax=Methanohalophilus mahii (strain ATCC 35705 / DSM 5219 / SLP) TaxID=547558 RepID=D5E6T4_METMS|nr:adenosylcobinamide amidohydrolase [Methanohalophilus mahii]ADE36872.1 protein of unknown function DUF105 [Methanohalophilus mahii DSM 5219]
MTRNELAVNSCDGDCEPLLETSAGEKIFRSGKDSVIVSLPKGRRIISNSWLNGGIRDDINVLINQRIGRHVGSEDDLEEGSVEGYLAHVVEQLGYSASNASALLTAASMENVAFVTHSFRGLEITTIATAGVEVNACSPADPASYYQENGRWETFGGTINLILLIDANLPSYALTRAWMTATEAKSAVLHQLMIPSRFSEELATGTGTDMMAIVSNDSASLKLTDAGPHSKLGELICKCIKQVLFKALDQQSGISAVSQRDMLVRLDRFGIDEKYFWKVSTSLEGDNKKGPFYDKLRNISRNPAMVALISSILHLVDEVRWGLIPENSAKKVAFSQMAQLNNILNLSVDVPYDYLLDPKESIIDNWVRVTCWIVKRNV